MCRVKEVQRHYKDDGTRDLQAEAMDMVFAAVAVMKVLMLFFIGKATGRQVLIALGYSISEHDDFDEAFSQVHGEDELDNVPLLNHTIH